MIKLSKNDQKFLQTPLNKLIDKVQKKVNEYIRKRDEGKPCISCQQYKTLQAGHFHSAGKFSRLRFTYTNIHGQCMQCNYYGHGELIKYALNITDRITLDELEELNITARNKKLFKWDKYSLLDIYNKTRLLIKEL